MPLRSLRILNMAYTESAQRGSILPARSIKQLHVARTCCCLSIAGDESE
jgi:hypothetical protein